MYFVEYHFLSYRYEYATSICDIREFKYLNYYIKWWITTAYFVENPSNPRTHKLLSDVTTWPKRKPVGSSEQIDVHVIRHARQ